MFSVDGLITATVTEGDQLDDFLQLSFVSPVPPQYPLGSFVEIDKYSGVVRQCTTGITNGQYKSTLVVGTQSLYTDTVIPGGYAFESKELDYAIEELFSHPDVNIDVRVTALTVPLQAEAMSIDGKTKVKDFIQRVTKVGKTKLFFAYFDLYRNFYLIPPDYTETTVNFDDIQSKIIDIHLDASLNTNKPENIVKASHTTPGTPAESGKRFIVNKKDASVTTKAYYKGPTSGRKIAPGIDSVNYIDPVYFGNNLNITIAGEVDFGLRTLFKIKTNKYNDLNGEFILRKKTTTYSNNTVITSITASEVTDKNRQFLVNRG